MTAPYLAPCPCDDLEAPHEPSCPHFDSAYDPPGLADADPDRPWAYRDSGHGAEDADDDPVFFDDLEPKPREILPARYVKRIGDIDTPESFAHALKNYPAFVTPTFPRCAECGQYLRAKHRCPTVPPCLA